MLHKSAVQVWGAQKGTRPTTNYSSSTVEAQKLETQWHQSLRVVYRESQHYLALIRFPTSWGAAATPPKAKQDVVL